MIEIHSIEAHESDVVCLEYSFSIAGKFFHIIVYTNYYGAVCADNLMVGLWSTYRQPSHYMLSLITNLFILFAL